MTDYKINNPLNEAEYVALAAIVRALKPIQLGCEKLCCRDVTLLSPEGDFSFIIEELHEQNSDYSLKLNDALIPGLCERIFKSTNRVSKMHKNMKIQSAKSR